MARFSYDNTVIAHSFCALNSDIFCGDLAHYWYNKRTNRLIICVLDGLGHGEPAYEAALQVKTNLELLYPYYDDLTLLLHSVHEATTQTRGASCGLAEIDFDQQILRYVGIGNIRAYLIDLTTQSVNHFPYVYGILGSGAFPQNLTTYDVILKDHAQMLLIYTDGLPELLRFHLPEASCSFDQLDQLTQHWMEQYMLKTDDALILACQLEQD